MDPLTTAVAKQYDRFPYPDTHGGLRADAFLEVLLAGVERAGRGGPLRVLDAGCGTGSGILPVASLYPEAQIVAADVSPGALASAHVEAKRLGVANVRFVEVDLLDAEALPRAAAGYDVIYASGVLHHLSDPAAGLRNLTSLLAPDGILVGMVYNTFGRQPVWRLARALDVLWADRTDLDRRVPIARALVESLPPSAATAAPWDDAASLPDNELVDRYLHALDRGYTVPELFSLLHEAGLQHVRWLEPRAWDVGHLVPTGPATELLRALPDLQRWTVLDLLFDHPSMSFLAARTEAKPRHTPRGEALSDATLALNPQASLTRSTRSLRDRELVSDFRVEVRGLGAFSLDPFQAVAVEVSTEPQQGSALVAAMREAVGASREEALQALDELVRQEVLFAPHPDGWS